MKLYRYELKKILLNKRTLIMLIILAVAYLGLGIGNCFFTFRGDSSYSEYKELADEVVGPYNAEFAAEAAARINEIKKYNNGGHSLESYCSKTSQDKLYLSYFNYAANVAKYMEENPGATDLPEYENVVLWESAFEGWGGTMVLILMMFPLAFIVAPVFTKEVSTGMDNLILSSANGRKKIVLAKLLATATTAVTLSAIYFVSIFVGSFLPYLTLDGASARVTSLNVMKDSGLSMSVGTFAFITFLWISLAAIAFSIIATLISSVLKNQASVFGSGILVLLLGIILNAFGSAFVEKVQIIIDFCFSNTLSTSTIFAGSKTFNLFGATLSYSTATLLVFAVMIIGGIILLFTQQKRRSIA